MYVYMREKENTSPLGCYVAIFGIRKWENDATSSSEALYNWSIRNEFLLNWLRYGAIGV